MNDLLDMRPHRSSRAANHGCSDLFWRMTTTMWMEMNERKIGHLSSPSIHRTTGQSIAETEEWSSIYDRLYIYNKYRERRPAMSPFSNRRSVTHGVGRGRLPQRRKNVRQYIATGHLDPLLLLPGEHKNRRGKNGREFRWSWERNRRKFTRPVINCPPVQRKWQSLCVRWRKNAP